MNPAQATQFGERQRVAGNGERCCDALVDGAWRAVISHRPLAWPASRLPHIVDALHASCRPQGAGATAENVVGTLNRSIPECHDAVADELVNGSPLLRNRTGYLFEIGRYLQ